MHGFIAWMAALALVLGTACGGKPTSSASVLLYTSVPEEIMRELEAAFEEAHPGITLDVFRATTGDVDARIATEQQAGGVRADVLWLAEPSSYEGFKADGVLAPYAPPEPDAIPPEYVDPDGFYVAARVINMVVAWNTDAVPQGLRDWADLYRVRGAFPAPSSGAALAAVKGLAGEVDQNFFTRFAEAGGVQVPSQGAARDAIVAGEYDAAGVLDYMIREAKAAGSPVDLAYPDSGTVVIPSPVALTASAANPQAARVFLDFLLSREGQELVVKVGGFYPARTDVAKPSDAPDLDSIKTITVDWKALTGEAPEIVRDWQKLFG